MENSGREAGLQNIAKAYMDVRDGKAICVMIVIREDDLEIHSGDATPVECLEMISRANVVVAKEVTTALDDVLYILNERDAE